MEKQPNNIRVSAKINKDLAFKICGMCELLNVTQSTFIRDAIKDYIENIESILNVEVRCNKWH